MKYKWNLDEIFTDERASSSQVIKKVKSMIVYVYLLYIFKNRNQYNAGKDVSYILTYPSKKQSRALKR